MSVFARVWRLCSASSCSPGQNPSQNQPQASQLAFGPCAAKWLITPLYRCSAQALMTRLTWVFHKVCKTPYPWMREE
eukprot:COSAG02_NODE_521_length_20750_cov_10.721079_18_plen_77_part_00